MNVTRAVLIGGLVLLQACVSTSTTPEHKPTQQEAAVANVNLGAGYSAARQARARDRGSAARDQAGSEARRRAQHARDRLRSARQPRRRRDALQEVPRSSSPTTPRAANAYAVFLCRHNRWKDAEPYFQKARRELQVSDTRSLVHECGRLRVERRRPRESRAELPRGAHTQARLCRRARGHARDVLSGQELHAGARVPRALSRREAATAEVLWMCFNIEDQLKNHDAANRCAAQLREGFPDSPELQQLNQVQKRNGRG